MAVGKPEVSRSQLIREILNKNPATPVKEIISTLADQGVSVTEGLVYFVKAKFKNEKNRQAREAAPSSNGPSPRSTPQQSAAGVKKAQVVRDFMTQNPKMPVPEVVAALAAIGVVVTKSHAYIIKGRMKAKKHREAKEKIAAADTATATSIAAGRNGDVLTTIRKIKSLANEMGGLKKLQALVDALVD